MVTYVYRDGQRLTPYMLYQINRLDADCRRLFGVRAIVSSAIRTYEDQKAIFLDRYVTAGNVRGRRVYDTRWWSGQLWYRISSAGTVAAPGSSNHEIQGSKAAVDLRDSGSDGGLATMGSARSNWLRANAGNYDMVPSGFGFGEAWHYDIRNIFNPVPGAPAGGGISVPKEDEMTVAIKLNGRHLYTVGEEFISHAGTVGQWDIARRVNSAQDEGHSLSTAQFNDYLDAMGIPRVVVNTSTGAVLNPQSGKHEGNGVWSRRREAVALAEANAKVLAELVKSTALTGKAPEAK
ncbi:endolysin [Microbacterium phage Gingerbug]|nr:endolysin [Microbacterium phage Gingerbug]